MSRWLSELCRVVGIATLILVTSFAGFVAQATAQERVVGWHTTIDEAQAVAKLSDKPIMLVFRCVQ